MTRRKSNTTQRREALQAIYSSLSEVAVGFDMASKVSNDHVSTWCGGMKALAEAAEILERLEAESAPADAAH